MPDPILRAIWNDYSGASAHAEPWASYRRAWLALVAIRQIATSTEIDDAKRAETIAGVAAQHVEHGAMYFGRER
jgi:hypothetical protein